MRAKTKRVDFTWLVVVSCLRTRRGLCVRELWRERETGQAQIEKVLVSPHALVRYGLSAPRSPTALDTFTQAVRVGGGEPSNSLRAMSPAVITRGFLRHYHVRCTVLVAAWTLAVAAGPSAAGRTKWKSVHGTDLGSYALGKEAICERAPYIFLQVLTNHDHYAHAMLFGLYPDDPPPALRRNKAHTATIAPMMKNFCPLENPSSTLLSTF